MTDQITDQFPETRPLGGTRGLPLSWYRGEKVDEQIAVFERTWQYVGRTDQLQKPGQFFRATVGRVPVLVVAQRDGSINAFHNVCRHRSAEVVLEDSGQRRALTCHYHAWTYDLDGCLKGAPRVQDEEDFDASALSLRRVKVETWGPFVFVNLDTAAVPLSDALGDMPAKIAAAGIDVDALRFTSRYDFTMECDWKVAVENYLECYHCPGAHPDFSLVLDTSYEGYELSLTDQYAFQRGRLKPENDAESPYGAFTGHEGPIDEALFFLIWPSLTVNVYPGYPNISIGPMLPGGNGKTEAFLDYFVGPDAPGEWIEGMTRFDAQVAKEDFVLVESVQRGINACSFDRPRILVGAEKLVCGFHDYIADQLARPGSHG